jgi:hypothetical protein
VKRVVLVSCVLAVVFLFTGCNVKTITTNSATPADQEAARTTSVKTVVEQVKESRHYKMFPALVAQAEKETAAKNTKFNYAMNCLKCKSPRVIREGDKTAQIPEFFTGNKYADRREGITCIDCHDMGGKDLFALRVSGWEACSQCHRNAAPSIKAGSRITDPQIQMIMGTPVGDNQAMPSYKWRTMKDTFSCTDCHITNNQRHTFFVPGVTATFDDSGLTRTGTRMDWDQFSTVFKQKKCVSCHDDPKPVVDKLKATQNEIVRKLDSLQPIVDEWSARVKKLDKNDPKVIAFNSGLTYFSYVRRDASKGCHNPEYARALLQNCEREWSKLLTPAS